MAAKASLPLTARVLSQDCTHVVEGLLELTGGVPMEIPLDLLPAALALPGVVQLPS